MEAPNLVGAYVCDMSMYFFPKLKSLSYGVTVTTTIFWYFIASAIYQKAKDPSVNGWPIGLLIVAFIGILGFQTWSIYVQGFYKKCSQSLMPGVLVSVIIGLLVGLSVFGGIAGGSPQLLPYVSSESFTTMMLNGGVGKTPPPPVIKDDASSNVEKSSKPDDKDEFVCDLYKNGQLVTSTVSE